MNKLVKSIVTRLSVLFLIYPVLALGASDKPVKNLTVFKQLAAKAVHEILEQVALDSSTSISIHPQKKQTEGNWLIENAMMQECSKIGIDQIYLYQVNDSACCNYGVKFQIMTLEVKYEAGAEKDELDRIFELVVSVRIVESRTGKVLAFDTFSETYRDTVQKDKIKNLQNKSFNFTQAVIPQNPGLKKYIEPSVVIATTLSIIYLFFRLRSS